MNKDMNKDMKSDDRDMTDLTGWEEFNNYGRTDIRQYNKDRKDNKDTKDRTKTVVVRGLDLTTTEQQAKEEVVKAVREKLAIELKVKEMKLMKPREGGYQKNMVAVMELESAEQVKEVLKEKRKLGESRIRLYADIPREERDRLRRERMAWRGGGQMGGGFGTPGQGLAELLLNLLQQSSGPPRGGRPGNGGRPYPPYHHHQYHHHQYPRFQR